MSRSSAAPVSIYNLQKGRSELQSAGIIYRLLLDIDIFFFGVAIPFTFFVGVFCAVVDMAVPFTSLLGNSA